MASTLHPHHFPAGVRVLAIQARQPTVLPMRRDTGYAVAWPVFGKSLLEYNPALYRPHRTSLSGT